MGLASLQSIEPAPIVGGAGVRPIPISTASRADGSLTTMNKNLHMSDRIARMHFGAVLPQPGHERLVVHHGKHYWLRKHRSCGWKLRATDWRLVDGRAVLSSSPDRNLTTVQ